MHYKRNLKQTVRRTIEHFHIWQTVFFNFQGKNHSMTLIKDGRYEKEVSDPKLSVDKSISYPVDLQTLRDRIVKEYRKNVRYPDHGWVVLEDESLAKLVLETFADEDKRNIMNCTLDNPRTITEILDICKIPKTTGYRTINSMIQNRLLVPKDRTRRGRRIFREYVSTIESVQIETARRYIIVRIRFIKSSKYFSS